MPAIKLVSGDHPPINTITATTVAELSDLAGLIEQDPDLNVVVFDSANRDFYVAHYDLENDPGRTEALGVGLPPAFRPGSTSLSVWLAPRWSAIAFNFPISVLAREREPSLMQMH